MSEEHYRVYSLNDPDDLEEKLNEAATDGYRVCHFAAHSDDGLSFFNVIVERCPKANLVAMLESIATVGSAIAKRSEEADEPGTALDLLTENGLSGMWITRLSHAGITTLEQLEGTPDNMLLRVHGVGYVTLNLIRNAQRAARAALAKARGQQRDSDTENGGSR